MKNFVKTFIADESGAAAAEYALILAVVGAAIGVSAVALGTEINASITRATGQITTANAAAGG